MRASQAPLRLIRLGYAVYCAGIAALVLNPAVPEAINILYTVILGYGGILLTLWCLISAAGLLPLHPRGHAVIAAYSAIAAIMFWLQAAAAGNTLWQAVGAGFVFIAPTFLAYGIAEIRQQMTRTSRR